MIYIPQVTSRGVDSSSLTLQSLQAQQAGGPNGKSTAQGYGKPWREATEVVQSPTSY